jgi:Ca2+-binding RTX toxin-like protein
MAEFFDTLNFEYVHKSGEGLPVPDGMLDAPVATDGGDIFHMALGAGGPDAPQKYGGDVVNGAGGIDTASFPRPMSDYQIKLNEDGTITVLYIYNGSPGVNPRTVTLADVETLTFADGYITLQYGPIAIYRQDSAVPVIITNDGEELWIQEDTSVFGRTFFKALGPGHSVHILAGPGNDNLTVRGDLSQNLSGDWANGLIQFYWGGGTGDNSIAFENAVVPYTPRTGDVLRSYGISLDLSAGNDTVDAGGVASPVYVSTTMSGGSGFGADSCQLSTECTGDWVDVSLAPAGSPVVANLATGTLTRGGVPVFAAFSGVDNLRLTNGNHALTGHAGSNIFLLGQGTSAVSGGGHGPGQIDAVGINGFDVFSGVTFDFVNETATGTSFNVTMTGMNAAFGGNSGDTFILAGGPKMVFGMAGNDTFSVTSGTGHIVGYEAPLDKLSITNNGNGTWQVFDTRAFNEVPSGKLKEGLDTVSGQITWVRASDAMRLLDMSGSGEVDIALDAVATGVFPELILGGAGAQDRVSVFAPDLPPFAKDFIRIQQENDRLQIERDFHDTLTKLMLDDVEHVYVYGDGDFVADGDLIQAGVGPNTLTLVGGANGNLMDASGVTSLSHVVLQGQGGNDTLAGGAGNDDLQGGAGSGDVASFIRATSAIVHTLGAGGAGTVTAAGMGTDTYSGIEGLAGGSAKDRLTGNAAANFLGGNGGNDSLSGLGGNDTLDGGAGADTMTGGAGNDTYYVDNASDRTTEAPGEGNDTVIASVSRALGANLENLTLAGAAIAGNGNTLANLMTGNALANRFDGKEGNDTLIGGDGDDELRGGTGNDSMAGGLGSDKYFIDNAGDIVSETTADPATGGVDTVYSQVSYTLGANLENLRLQTANPLSGTGNTLANKIYGNSGANLLQGLGGNDTLEGKDGADTLDGGEGNDTLTGGSQADVFRFATSNAGVDRILDFNKNGDRFDLSGGSFTALSIAPNGDAVLTHTGGTVRIANPPSLSLAQWNALVLPSGAKTLPGTAPMDDATSHLFDAGAGHTAALLRHDFGTPTHGDWAFA